MGWGVPKLVLRYASLIPPPRGIAVSMMVSVVAVIALSILVGVAFWAWSVLLGAQVAMREESGGELTGLQTDDARKGLIRLHPLSCTTPSMN